MGTGWAWTWTKITKSHILTLRRFPLVWACARGSRIASKIGRARGAIPIGRVRRGRIDPNSARRIHKRGARKRSQAESNSLGQWQGLERTPMGSQTSQQPAAPPRANLRAPSGAWRRRNHPSGSMAAQPVTPVAAGYVNSGQRAIRGRFTPLSLGWARLHGDSLALWRGSEAPLSHGSGHRSGVCGRLALPTFPTRSSGAGHVRYPPSWACAVAGHPLSGGACSAGGRPHRARSLAQRTASWETQWGQLDRSLEALSAQPARASCGWGNSAHLGRFPRHSGSA
jgi:hypothetical protein